MAEIKEYPKASLLESMVSRLEAAPNEEGAGEGSEHDDADEGDPFSDLRLDPEEYDEELVSQFDKMVDLLKKQSEEIKTLKGQQSTSQQADWFDGAVKGLDKSLVKAMEAEPGRRDALRNKFDFLKAANEAAGQEVSPEAVLKEAVQITMGDLVTKAAVQKEAAKISKRAAQITRRPGGHHEKDVKGAKGTEAEIVGEINAEIAAMN